MERSVFLAKLIGPLLFVMGTGILVNGRVFQAMAEEFLHSYALIYLSGLLAFVAGLAIVIAHNVWARDWRLAITVLGWLSTLGGFLRIVLPQVVERIGAAVFASRSVMIFPAIILVVLGAWLSFVGFFANNAAPNTGAE